MLQGNFMVINAYNRKEKISSEKEEQAKHNSSRINEIMKIGMEIIKMENRKSRRKKFRKTKSVFLKENTNYQNQGKKNISSNPTEIQKD